ncbi:MAG: Transcription antitermination protein nusG [candidate division TM6 bacterium GW2011_GWE2_41_16]|nr:MAG: Transcription antitermination protein nusG [candidate division TM6 bacterium GW2011_GWE2_41_16]
MKKWYVIQVYAGYEEHVQREIERRIQEQGLEECFGKILIPSAKMRHFFDAADALRDEQLFPGYMLVELEPQPETFRLVGKAPRVLRFLGGKDPVALSQREMDRITKQMSGDFVMKGEDHGLEVGKEVEVSGGPFIGFSGVIDSIDEENDRLVVMVSIFGRMTPVELTFDQIKH